MGWMRIGRVMSCAVVVLVGVSACSIEDLNQIDACSEAASKQFDAYEAERLGRPDAARIQREADEASAKCDSAVNANLDSDYGPSGGFSPSDGINTDPSDGRCDSSRFMQDPDC